MIRIGCVTVGGKTTRARRDDDTETRLGDGENRSGSDIVEIALYVVLLFAVVRVFFSAATASTSAWFGYPAGAITPITC